MAPNHYLRVTTAMAKALAVSALLLSVLAFTPRPAEADGFDTLYAAESVCQEIRTFQTGVGDEEQNTISIPEGPGPIVAAFATWIGVNDLTPDLVTEPGQADSTLVVNGNDIVGVAPSGVAASQKLEDDKYWYAWNADIGPSGANILNGSSKHELSISGWKITNEDQYHGRNGAEIDIVYDVSPCSTPVDVTILSGVDWIYEPLGHPGSTTMVLPVATATEERVETVRLSLWGGDKSADRCRFSALWMLTGSEPIPAGEQVELFAATQHQPAFGINNAVEIVANPFLGPNSDCAHEANPEPDVPYETGHLYPTGATSAPYNAVAVRRHALTSDAEVLSIEVELRVPADSTWIALQLESEGEHYGESGAWTANFTTPTIYSETASSSINANPPVLVDEAIVPEAAPAPQQGQSLLATETEPQPDDETEVQGLTISRDNPANLTIGSTQANSSTSGSGSASNNLALTGTSTFALVGAALVMIFAGFAMVRRRRFLMSGLTEV